MKKVVVLSLGGSLIIPNEVDVRYLKNFKKVILENKNKYKFIIVCGGGSTARKYINGLRSLGIGQKEQSLIGMASIMLNSEFMGYFFGMNLKEIHHSISSLKKHLEKNDVAFCGALEYHPKETSDSTAAEITSHFKSPFVNLTDVPGLFDKNPKEHKDAKLIPEISWKNFHKIANKTGFKPGQHFVLDQNASAIIMKNEITTYVIGKDLNQLDNILKGKKFKGTIIFG
jgi:uridylate kinase